MFNLSKSILLALIIVLFIAVIVVGFQLDWKSIFRGDIGFSSLLGLLTAVFLLMLFSYDYMLKKNQ